MKTPFLWAGSKDRDYKTIKSYIPDFEYYHEPFLGGGSVYFRLLAERGSFKASCADIHEELILVYEAIRDNPEKLIKALPLEKDRATFDELRKKAITDPTERAGRFLYLNRNRFFGLGGWMNADRYARAAVVERIRFFHPLMQESTFSSKGCWDMTIENNSFVFCDPPYPETNNTACYRMDDDVSVLNLEFFDYLHAKDVEFLWTTKFSPWFFDHASRDDTIVEKKPWTFRKPSAGVQQNFEIYASRLTKS